MRCADRREFLKKVGAGSLAAMGVAASGTSLAKPQAAAAKPNILFILIDDLGWPDIGCYGSTYHPTPVVDAFAKQGMKFTDAYAACPVCSPTRASILTGKYPASVGVTDFIPGHWRPFEKLVVPKIHNQLPLKEVTIPEALKKAGYVSACFGKWHLGWGKQFSPAAQGFDVVGHGQNKGDKAVVALTDKAIDFLGQRKAAADGKPFFFFLSHHTVHIPLQAPKELVEKHRKRLKPGQKHPQQANPAYAAMIEYMDQQIGRLLKKLDELGLADSTMVIFYSDNGGLKCIYTGKGEIVTSNAPLRDEKGSMYEGGIRVPLIVRWPGKIKPGSVCREPVTSTDFLPTFLEMAGLGKPAADVDGVSLMPLLKQTGGLDRDAIFWHYPHYHHTTPCGAIRAGKWKLIEYFDDGRLELYDLEKDLGEEANLAGKMPDRAGALQKKLAAWRKSVGALMPTKNPKHNPARAGEWHRRARPKPKLKPRPAGKNRT